MIEVRRAVTRARARATARNGGGVGKEGQARWTKRKFNDLRILSAKDITATY